MIQALKTEPTSTPSGQAPAKDARTPDPSFDPMLASLVAQMLGALQQAPPQASAPAAPRPEPQPSRTEASAASRPQEGQALRTAERMEHRPARKAESPGTEPERPQGEAERAQAERPAAAADREAAPDPQARTQAQDPSPVAEAAEASAESTLPSPVPVGAEPTAPSEGAETAVPLEQPAGRPSAPKLRHAVTDERTSEIVVQTRETQAPVVVEKVSTAPRLSEAAGMQALPTAVEGIPVEAATAGPEAPVAQGEAKAGQPGAPAPSAPVALPLPSTRPESTASIHPGITPLQTRPAPEPKAPEAVPAKPQASAAPVTPLAAAAVTAVASGRESAPALGQGAKPESRIQAVGSLHAPAVVASPARTQAATALAAPAKTAPHPVLTQVDGTIRWILRKQEQGAELQLHPESLGKVQIKLTVEGQQVHAQVWASEASTLPILRENLAFLEVSLREQGLSLGHFQLHQGDRGQDAAFAQPQASSPGPSGGLGVTEALQEVPLSVPAPLLGAYRIEVFA